MLTVIASSLTSTSPVTAEDDTYVSIARAAQASGVVAALERMWNQAIKSRHPDLPNAVIVLASGTVGMRPGTIRLGHFAQERWTVGTDRLPEMFVSGEGLADGPVEVLGTLLHEAAHAVAAVRGIQDTSRQGRWHNTRFKTLAEELGLHISKAPGIGWSTTQVPAGTQALYRDAIGELHAAITIWRRTEQDVLNATPPTTPDPDNDDGDGDGGDPPAAPTRGNGLAAVCGCPKPRRIRVAVSVLDLGAITCGLCAQPFRPRPTDPH